MMQSDVRVRRTARKKAFKDKVAIRAFISFLVLVAFVGILAGTVYGVKKWMQCCPYFFVSAIKVEGVSRVSPKDIILASGVKKGDSIFDLNFEAIRTRVMKNPWVKDAKIERQLPDSVIIRVRERKPAGLVRLGQRIYITDGDGVIFKALEPEDDFVAPVITGIEIKKFDDVRVKKSNKAVDLDKLKEALKIIKLSKRGVRALGFYNISQIDFPDDDSIVIYTKDRSIPFHLNRNHLKEQFRRAEKILVKLYDSGQYQKVLTVDVGYGANMALAKLK